MWGLVAADLDPKYSSVVFQERFTKRLPAVRYCCLFRVLVWVEEASTVRQQSTISQKHRKFDTIRTASAGKSSAQQTGLKDASSQI